MTRHAAHLNAEVPFLRAICLVVKAVVLTMTNLDNARTAASQVFPAGRMPAF